MPKHTPLITPDSNPGLRLELVTGPRVGECIPLSGHTTLFIGRGPGVQIALPGDALLSRVHFCVEHNWPLARITDLRSRNGTFLNDVRLQAPADLRDGDRIRAGATQILVRMNGEPTAVPDPESSPATSSALFLRPDTSPTLEIPGYSVERLLGAGGMGEVHAARRESDGMAVAVKIIRPAVHPTREAVGRFQREIAILEQLSHPHIVRLLGSGIAGGVLYFVMERINGRDANRVIKDEGPFSTPRAVRLICQLLDALHAAHDKGFVHRDVKPSNLMLTGQGESESLKLTDFGLARAYEASMMSGLTVTGESGGTPGFMPPEQVLDFRSAKPPADQYAVAATLFFLLTGRLVFDGAPSRLDLLLRILQDEPIPLRQPYPGPPLPEPILDVLRRALARKPEDRFPDVLAMRAALLACER